MLIQFSFIRSFAKIICIVETTSEKEQLSRYTQVVRLAEEVHSQAHLRDGNLTTSGCDRGKL